MAVPILTSAELDAQIKLLAGWSIQNGKLHKQFQFKDFIGAFGFMASMALVSESGRGFPASR